MAYKCGVCSTTSCSQYLTCNHPACPDGRDQASYSRYPDTQAQQSPLRTDVEDPSLHWFAVAAIAIALLFAMVFAARAEEPEALWKRYAKKYNCEWVNHQLQTQSEEQLEAKARKWHVPEELIQLAKQCPR